MQNRLQIFAAAFIVILVQNSHGQDRKDNETLDLKKNLQPFINSYCIDCHGMNTQEGQVRFDRTEWQIKNNDTAQRWQDVLDQLNVGDMPPREAKQPADEELTAVLEQLTNTLVIARRRLTDNGGEIRMRRLNKREYSNTIRSLFGFDVALDDIPDNGEIESFDTVGTEQYFTSMHLEAYLQLYRLIFVFLIHTFHQDNARYMLLKHRQIHLDMARFG